MDLYENQFSDKAVVFNLLVTTPLRIDTFTVVTYQIS